MGRDLVSALKNIIQSVVLITRLIPTDAIWTVKMSSCSTMVNAEVLDKDPVFVLKNTIQFVAEIIRLMVTNVKWIVLMFSCSIMVSVETMLRDLVFAQKSLILFVDLMVKPMKTDAKWTVLMCSFKIMDSVIILLLAVVLEVMNLFVVPIKKHITMPVWLDVKTFLLSAMVLVCWVVPLQNELIVFYILEFKIFL